MKNVSPGPNKPRVLMREGGEGGEGAQGIRERVPGETSEVRRRGIPGGRSATVLSPLVPLAYL